MYTSKRKRLPIISFVGANDRQPLSRNYINIIADQKGSSNWAQKGVGDYL